MSVFAKLAALSQAAGPDTKTIEVKIGEKVEEVTIRRLTFQETQDLAVLIFENKTSDDGSETIAPDKANMGQRGVKMICMSVVSDPPMTVEQVRSLHPDIGNQLIAAINAFNGMGQKAKPVQAAAKNS